MLSLSSNRVLRWLTFAALAVALVSPGPLLLAAELTGSRPNIILIITDDQGYGDLACHGNPVIKTPNLDKLHSESARLTDFHVSPTCAPTRSAVLTGRHEFFNGVTHTIQERERLRLDAITLPTVLKQAGYTTAIFGKWHLGDEPEYWPSQRGYDEMFIHGCGGIGQSYPGTCGDCPGNKYTNPVINHNGKLVATEGYCTDVFFKQAQTWIDKQRQEKKPFYLQITTNAPHAPYIVPKQYSDVYEGKVPPEVAKFYGMIANIDENVGMLREKLRDWKLDENTLLIFMTDNGSAAGDKVFNAGMRGKKGTPFLGGTRVPSFWHLPGKISAGDVTATTAHVDIFPTLAELAGATLPEQAKQQIQGRSLVPLLSKPQANWPDRYLVTHVGRWEAGLDVANATPNQAKYANCSIRWKNYQAVRTGKNAAKGWELFDLAADPGENQDVADKHPEIVKQLDAEYDRWWASVVPNMVNETATATAAKNKLTPYKKLYWNQFRGPGPNNVPPPEGFEFTKVIADDTKATNQSPSIQHALLMSMVAMILICTYLFSRLSNSKPPELNVVGHGGLHRWTDTFFNFEGEAFEGGVLVLKNNGVIFSTAVSYPNKGSFSIEKVGNGQTFMHCPNSPQTVLLLDLEAELKLATDWRWLHTNRDFDFQNDECLIQQQEILLNNIANTYKIIITRNYKMSLSKYSRYSPQTHPGINTTKLDPIPRPTTP